jgi:hypothetical protein
MYHEALLAHAAALTSAILFLESHATAFFNGFLFAPIAAVRQ